MTDMKIVLRKKKLRKKDKDGFSCYIGNVTSLYITGFVNEDKLLRFPCRTNDDISNVAPLFSPTFNFAAYINKSKTLQELVKLGVDLHQLEKKKGIPQFILKLDFDRDMKEYIRFLHDHGVPPDQLGIFFTRNPLIFKEDLENLQVRINYLLSKRFSSDNISRIITKNPYWLSFSTRRIDRRLGHFQKSFSLKGDEIRTLTIKQPRLITFNMDHIKLTTFSVKEEMGFQNEEIKKLLLHKPKLWMMSQNYLLSRFNFVHNEMKLPHERITLHPQVLGSRLFRIKQRHLFLKSLDRAQYDPLKPGYISLDRLVAGSDAEFCERVANTSTEMFNMFLKTM
uniref:Transcription termination factor 3, mitochondrial n=1 Tax=Timema poppense TaxID=170557 RepID=A0A7R9H3V6_TIMPO|nr:unnamed protein product [Timema poppensis]